MKKSLKNIMEALSKVDARQTRLVLTPEEAKDLFTVLHGCSVLAQMRTDARQQWNADAYRHGIANALEEALATLEGRPSKLHDAPARYTLPLAEGDGYKVVETKAVTKANTGEERVRMALVQNMAQFLVQQAMQDGFVTYDKALNKRLEMEHTLQATFIKPEKLREYLR